MKGGIQMSRQVRSTLLVLVASLIAVQIGLTVAHAAEAELMGKEKLSGERVFCVDIQWREEANSSSPTLYLTAGFSADTNGYFEVNGDRVYSWIGKGKFGNYVQYPHRPINKGGIYRVTIGVESTTTAETFRVSSTKPIVGIRKVACEAEKR
jgi:hypothetical protein